MLRTSFFDEASESQRQTFQGQSPCLANTNSNAATSCAKAGDKQEKQKGLTFFKV